MFMVLRNSVETNNFNFTFEIFFFTVKVFPFVDSRSQRLIRLAAVFFFNDDDNDDIDDGSLNACCFTWTKTCWSNNNKIHIYIYIRIQGNQNETYISMCNRGISKREMWIEQSDGKKRKNLGILHYGQLKCEKKTSMYSERANEKASKYSQRPFSKANRCSRTHAHTQKTKVRIKVNENGMCGKRKRKREIGTERKKKCACN